MVRVRLLSHLEVDQLKRLHRTTQDADVRSRCDMILLSAEGCSPPQIAQRVRFSRHTVVRYIRRYEQEGLNGLFTRPRSGRPPRATAAYCSKLVAAVEHPPRQIGLRFSNWTTEKLADHLMQQTGIRLSARQVENLLKREGFRLNRPVRTVKHKQVAEAVAEKKTHRSLAQAR